MLLVSPPTLLSVTEFQGYANDFDLSSYTTQQIQDKLCAATAAAEAICRRPLVAREETRRYIGDGSDKLDLQVPGILYVKRAQIVVPGPTGYAIPVNELLVDYQSGDAFEYAPLYFAGAGYRSVFPYGAPIDITLGWGLGYTAAKSPAFTLADLPNGGSLAAGAYNVAVSARTFFGETAPAVTQYTTSSGAFSVAIVSGIGVYIYRVYVSSASDNTTITSSPGVGATTFTVAATAGMTAGSQWLLGSGTTSEVVTISSVVGSTVTVPSGLQYSHTTGDLFILAPLLVNEVPVSAYGTSTITTGVSTLNPANGLFPDAVPTTDTSAPVVPWAMKEAIRLLTLSAIYEQNNLANRGIYQQRSAERMTSWKSTEGMSGKGVPTMWQQATQLLDQFVFRGLV